MASTNGTTLKIQPGKYLATSPLACQSILTQTAISRGDMHYWGVWHGNKPFTEFQKVNTSPEHRLSFQAFCLFELALDALDHPPLLFRVWLPIVPFSPLPGKGDG